MKLSFSNFAWGSSRFNVDTLQEQIIQLPTKNGEIDFDFMERFIAELEEERIAELTAYLKVSGQDNYELSEKERKAIENYSNVSFEDVDLINIFDVKNTSNILSANIEVNSGITPYLSASAANNSVSTYIEYDPNYLEKGHCIFIGGKTFVVSYQKDDFFLNDSHNLALYIKGYNMTKLKYLYLAASIRKSLSHKYSWGNSVSKAKIKTEKLTLPVKNNKIDFEIMELLISAVQKLVIKDVVMFADKKISAAKSAAEKK